MHCISIPPKYRCWLFRSVRSVSPYLCDYKIVFAPFLDSAVQYLRRFCESQGIDNNFYFLSEVSFGDIHLFTQDITQCVLDL